MKRHAELPNGKAVTTDVSPLLVRARAAAALCGVSVPTWWRLHAGGLVPSPLKLAGATLWRVEELTRWIAADCPDRERWELLEAVRNGR